MISNPAFLTAHSSTIAATGGKRLFMIVCDAHVHLYPQFSAERLLASARDNFFTQYRDCWSPPPIMALLFADNRRAEGFTTLAALAEGGGVVGKFQLRKTAEGHSLLAIDPSRPEERLLLLGGRQVVTAERIEVLALASPAFTEDGLPLAETVAVVQQRGGLAILPWGVGKWLGRRGAIIGNYLNQADPSRLLVGDNGGRPILWPKPALFEKAAARGIGLLSGSDPLPLPGEERRVGSYGAILAGSCGDDYPAQEIISLLTSGAQELKGFGKNLDPFSFLKTQIALRLAK
jgi:hypothetical protein